MTGTKKNTGKLFSVVFTLALICLITAALIPGVKGASAVDLGSANYFAILAETAITGATGSDIMGNVGTSGTISTLTCPEVTGTIYTVGPGAGGPSGCTVENSGLLAAAVSDMQAANNTAMGLSSPNYIDVGSSGEIGGLTLGPGLYRFNTAVTISGDVNLSGNSNDVWIFQIPGTSALTSGSGTNVILLDGAQAQNVFWVVGGATTLGTGSGFNGTILDSAAITLDNGATLNGRALAQSAVTLDGANTVTAPASAIEITVANVPADALSLNPDTATTNSATQYFINSSSNWQVTASDGGGNPTPGYMYNYSNVNGFQSDHLSLPFRVQLANSAYANLTTSQTLMTGEAEVSSTTYNLGISQRSKYADPILPGTNVYRITVALTATNIG
ncbi:MAG: ice-binding family protein [Methanoregula sp.]|uniref:ice-binding family protein n=1 Tax=Methanoregula sp. TaxID=2052170 RepID=UPI003D1446E6